MEALFCATRNPNSPSFLECPLGKPLSAPLGYFQFLNMFYCLLVLKESITTGIIFFVRGLALLSTSMEPTRNQFSRLHVRFSSLHLDGPVPPGRMPFQVIFVDRRKYGGSLSEHVFFPPVGPDFTGNISSHFSPRRRKPQNVGGRGHVGIHSSDGFA